jgi:hypothetical protein
MRVDLRKLAVHSLPAAIGSLPNELGRCVHGGSQPQASTGRPSLSFGRTERRCKDGWRSLRLRSPRYTSEGEPRLVSCVVDTSGAQTSSALPNTSMCTAPSVPVFGQSYNVAPQTFQPVIRLNRDSGEREIVLMRCGLIPYWILLANSEGAPEVSEKRTSRAVDCRQISFHPRRACSRILRRPMFAKAVSRCGQEGIVRIDCPPHQPYLSVWACGDASIDRFTLGCGSHQVSSNDSASR